MKIKCSYAWIGSWAAIFLLSRWTTCGELLSSKGCDVINGEYYRLFTGLLLHVNWFHLMVNCIAMYYVCEILSGLISEEKMLLLSSVTGVIANAIFSVIYTSSESVGGSPVVFSLIGGICVLQLLRKDLPRVPLTTGRGRWILAYAILGNIPIFSGNISTLVIHGIAFLVAVILSVVAVKCKFV